MTSSGMSMGGIAPSVLRELSGVYKPFVKAFKELVSNAFDADADTVRVEFADDFAAVTIYDDGVGMTPFEFRYDFTRIGGSSRRVASAPTGKGRPRIGSKGIGFLALARYCDVMEVQSSRSSDFRHRIRVPKTPGNVDLSEVLGVPISRELLGKRLRVKLRGQTSSKRKLREGVHYGLTGHGTRLIVRKDIGPLLVDLSVDCRALCFTATLDFRRLLRLADTADLEKLEDFATIQVHEATDPPVPGTRIVARTLKEFVRRELRADRRKGFVRNVSSLRGLERFNWHLARCTPVQYRAPNDSTDKQIRKLLGLVDLPSFAALVVSHGNDRCELTRPIYPFEPTAPPLQEDMLVRVNIDEGGITARGFLAGYESIVFPAEYRGISIRVHGVAIGEPGFLGAEYLLTGAQKAALSQITGEINVLSGLDALDAINPGRESFYDENEHFKVLRRALLGDGGEHIAGYLGQAVAAVLRRSQVRSSLRNVLGRITCLRHALDDISSGITHLVSHGDPAGTLLKQLLKRRSSHTNGLASARDFELGIPTRIAGMDIVQSKHLSEPAIIDFKQNRIEVDVSRPEWDNSLVLYDRRFDVLHKEGRPTHPIAEVDFRGRRVLINWGHPVRGQMDERGFLRTALAWILARCASRGDADQMMDLAVKLLSYSIQRDG